MRTDFRFLILLTFSAPKALAERFATAWAVEAEASLSDDPQDAVDLMHSHRRDFRSTARLPDIPNHRLRRARGHDLDDVALLCEKYSNTVRSNFLPFLEQLI